jgi:hypothetical protein
MFEFHNTGLNSDMYCTVLYIKCSTQLSLITGIVLIDTFLLITILELYISTMIIIPCNSL